MIAYAVAIVDKLMNECGMLSDMVAYQEEGWLYRIILLS